MKLIADGVRPSFGGHEKFVFRHGWLKKGVDAAQADPFIFTKDEALVLLGVGKNMVASIRHWCLATGLLFERSTPGKARPLAPTTFASRLIMDNGWDPYLEDSGSLWLLHWQLVSNQAKALVWSLAFSAYLEAEFSKKQLIDLITKQVELASVRTTQGSIEREVDTFLRAYASANNKDGLISEESLDCPLAELDLIRYLHEDNLYRFNIGPKESLPAAVFGYALLSFLPGYLQNRRTVAVEEILYQTGSPGQAFKLDENSLVEYLEQLESLLNGALRLNETAGLRQLYLDENLISDGIQPALDLLNGYYAR